MIKVGKTWERTYKNAIGRWSGVGPYYAMFPLEFAFDAVSRFTNPGDWVLDPFAGRFSSIYAATSQKRNGLGIEINPVGWLYGKAKLNPASQEEVEHRLQDIAFRSRFFGVKSRSKLPLFFEYCYAPRVLSFLLAARNDLNWKEDQVDATLMSLILVCLHAKLGSGLSNQMRQSKAMAPDYSIRWWQKRNMSPPDIDPLEFMLARIRWRYRRGRPNASGKGIAILGDSTEELDKIHDNIKKNKQAKFKLVLTSPPYHDITHYHYDQWLRHWMLGGNDFPQKLENTHRGRFSSKLDYKELLHSVFSKTAQMVTKDAIILVRTDKRVFTLETTRSVLLENFPQWTVKESEYPVTHKTQTTLFGDFSSKPGEIDIFMYRI